MKIFITHPIPNKGITLLKSKGYEVSINSKKHNPAKEDVIQEIQGEKYDAILNLLNDKFDAAVFDAAGSQLKIVANYAVGYDNIDIKEAEKRGVMVTNTPNVLTDTVAEHTFALMLSIAHRIAEADRFMRAEKYTGWEPMLLLGSDVSKKTLGVVGLGRIGSRVAYHGAKGFQMNVRYYDLRRNEEFEKETGAVYRENVDELLREADFVSIHVPLLDSTKHLLNKERLAMMKKDAYIINTSRGPVIDESALVDALKRGVIKGAALDVFENEPAMAQGLKELENVILTPHIASGTEETRQAMSELAAQNIIAALEEKTPPNLVIPKIAK